MRPPKQKQPQVKKGLCRLLEHVDDHDKVSSHGLVISLTYLMRSPMLATSCIITH